MRLANEFNIIQALHKRKMAQLTEGLQDNVRHQDTPYHEDVDKDIIPDNLGDTEDEETSWLDGTAYQCPECDGYFVSPEQLNPDDDVECPYCGEYVVPDEVEDFDADDFEEVSDEDEDEEDEEEDEEDEEEDEEDIDDEDEEDEDDEEDDDEEDEDDDDEDIDEDVDEDMVRNGQKVRGARLKKLRKIGKDKHKAKRGKIRKHNSRGKFVGFVKDPLTPAQRHRIALASHKGGAEAKRRRSRNKKHHEEYNNAFPMYLDMDENSVMAVINKALHESFSYDESYIPFKITDITEAVYYQDADRLELSTDIIYKDGEVDTAEFELTGINEGVVEIKETTDKFDMPNIRITGTGAIVNESILIN